MNLDLTGKHALVCGASEGIGRAAAFALAQLGADVTVLSRSADKLAAVVAALPRRHDAQKHGQLAVDVADTDALKTKAQALAFGHAVQILVHNSGGPPPGPAHQADPDEYARVFRQHLIAGQVLVQALLPGMRAAGYGRVVNVISTSVKEPLANLGVSNTVRAAVAGWAKTLARELGPFGITVNNVLPGFTRTARLDAIVRERAAATGKSEADVAAAMLAAVPAGRFAEPEETANAVAFLASPAAAYINGINLPVDGGRTGSL